MAAWSLKEPVKTNAVFDIAGHKIENFRIEQQFKGNYLLQATVDGKKLKYVIRKGTPEHYNLTQTGLSNLSDDNLIELAQRYLLTKVD